MRSFKVLTTSFRQAFCAFRMHVADKRMQDSRIRLIIRDKDSIKKATLFSKSCLWMLFYLFLFVDSSDTRKNLSFDCLKQCTTTGRYVRHAACQAELVDTSYRVTATYE